MLSKAGIRVCASQNEKVSLGPVMSSCIGTINVSTNHFHGRPPTQMEKGRVVSQTFGTSPLKKLEKPSFLAILVRMRKPLSGFSKLRFWIRVLMTSRGADTIRDAEEPATDATKFCPQVALL